MDLVTYPWDITVLPQDQAAVTLPEKEILILRTAGKPQRIRGLQVGIQCWGIVYHENHLFVVCQGPDSLLVLDMQGNVYRDIKLKAAMDYTFSDPLYIAVGEDGHTLYISHRMSNLVARLTLQGMITGLYKQDKLRNPNGIAVLEDGSLLMCCWGSGTIHHISADMKEGRTLAAGVHCAQSVCYHAGNTQIYVSGGLCNQINVFRIQ